ncbi:hypothetical protein PR048_017285 [Dryococelus australis]|uniref:Uncharacterized protein n=1 Tax=Dryococelus australis TaxID=614101 RepID=A0ABQ9H960_9NEOP|nr:hypothetical protein PR048_017285 [Dryococelus australis]
MKERGKREIPEKTPPTSSLVQHDSHMRKSGSDPAGNRTRFALMGGRVGRRSHFIAQDGYEASGEFVSRSGNTWWGRREGRRRPSARRYSESLPPVLREPPCLVPQDCCDGKRKVYSQATRSSRVRTVLK